MFLFFLSKCLLSPMTFFCWHNHGHAIITPCTRQTLLLPEYHDSSHIEGKCVCNGCTVWGLVPSEGKLCSSLCRSSNTTLSSSSSGRTPTGLLRWSDRLQTVLLRSNSLHDKSSVFRSHKNVIFLNKCQWSTPELVPSTRLLIWEALRRPGVLLMHTTAGCWLRCGFVWLATSSVLPFCVEKPRQWVCGSWSLSCVFLIWRGRTGGRLSSVIWCAMSFALVWHRLPWRLFRWETQTQQRHSLSKHTNTRECT